MNEVRAGSAGPARPALPALASSVLVPFVYAGPRSVFRALVGVAGLALAAVGVWWTLGMLCVRVDNAAQAAGAVRGSRSTGFLRFTAAEAGVEADTDSVPVGIDGEHVLLPVPVVCRSAPGALRIRVPRDRPGARPNRPGADWRRVTRLALRRPPPGDRFAP
ncbi:hypothetical protein ACIP79_04305 [Streptomyces sp. NPDC088747]|uniref:hypothetical protein n=1 Tax=Streptomyces sp. NPDC088747 TaxID=3365886 RepID=UPI00382468F7